MSEAKHPEAVKAPEAPKPAESGSKAVEQNASKVSAEAHKAAEKAMGASEKNEHKKEHPEQHDDAKPEEHPVEHSNDTKGKGKSSKGPNAIRSLIDEAQKLTEGSPASGGQRLGTLVGGTALGLGIGSAPALAGTSAVGSALASTANWTSGALTSVAKYIGLGTGTNATSNLMMTLTNGSWMPTLPAWLGGASLGNAIGPAIVGAGALYGIGKLKSLVTRETYPGVIRPMWEAMKIPAEVAVGGVKLGYNTLMKGPGYVADKAYKTVAGALNWGIKKPLGFLKNTVWDKAMKPALAPTAWGVGGAVGGALLGTFTGGNSYIVGGLGYMGMNLAKHMGWIGGSGNSAPSSSGNGHH